MQAGMNKALLPLAGQPVLAWSLAMWQQPAERIYVAAQLVDWPHMQPVLAPYGQQARLVVGGSSRAASLAQALAALPPGDDETAELIAVHDGARPLTSAADIQRVIAAAEVHGAAILAAPVTDTVRFRESTGEHNSPLQANGLCGEVVPREQLIAAQTPQIFRRDWLLAAYAQADEQQLSTVTDDAALLQACGYSCAYVWAEKPNLKLTTPEDLHIAETLLKLRSTEANSC